MHDSEHLSRGRIVRWADSLNEGKAPSTLCSAGALHIASTTRACKAGSGTMDRTFRGTSAQPCRRTGRTGRTGWAGRLLVAGVSLDGLRKRPAKHAPAVPKVKQAFSTSRDLAAGVRRRRWFRGGALLVPVVGLVLFRVGASVDRLWTPGGFPGTPRCHRPGSAGREPAVPVAVLSENVGSASEPAGVLRIVAATSVQ